MKLKGHNIILTGASRGFGKYLFTKMLKEGANVFAVARNIREVCLVRPEGNVAKCVKADLELDGTEEFIVREASSFFGSKIDGLVNNAAILGPVGPSWSNDWNAWLQTLDINLLAPVRLCQLVAPIMLAQGSGSIVNLSGGGAASVRENHTAYATSKAGLVRFSETLAAEMKMPGVRVNCVSPGQMATQMNPDLDPRHHQNDMLAPSALITFLLSDESVNISGKLISANWDPWADPKFLEKLQNPDFCTLRRCMDEV